MTSDSSGASTSREPTPAPRCASTVVTSETLLRVSCGEKPSQDFYDAKSSSNARPSRLAPLISSALIDTGTEAAQMVGGPHEDVDRTSNYAQHPGESIAAYLGGFPSVPSRMPIGPSPQMAAPPRASEDVPPGVNYPGQPDFRTSVHHHPYAQRPGYIGQYAPPVQHMGVPHPAPPQFTYHGYHPPHHAQVYSYQGHTPENSPPARTLYNTSSIYAHQSRTPTSQGTPPFAGAAYTLQYPSPEFTYRPHNYFPNSPLMYQTAQYGPPQYVQHFASLPDADRRAEWWYPNPGSPVPSQQQHDAGRPLLAFRRHHTYPYSQLPPHASHALFSPPTRATPGVDQGDSSSPSPSTPGIGPSQSNADSSCDEKLTSERPMVRRSYHPKPPLQRSEWTMWAGNVPSDATHEEVWQFFQQLPSQKSDEPKPSPVVSVFLINRSNCAFINYDTEAHLKEAIEHFNGNRLRPEDPRCLKLVCRVRKKDDDLKAGVGAQRGTGIHVNWIKEQKARRGVSPLPDRGESSHQPLVRMMSSLSVSSNDDDHRRRPQPKSSSSGSYSSTTSSVLARYFPRRYFILKSLTQHDLDLSFEKGLWATQRHNEGVLDQAYRTSQEVFLIFGVNKSGGFYGYAKMAGPIQSGEQQVAWEARKTDSPSRDTPVSHFSASGEPPMVLPQGDTAVVVESPLPASNEDDSGYISTLPIEESPALIETDASHTQTAPAELGPQYQRLSVDVPQSHYTYVAPRHERDTMYPDAAVHQEPEVIPEEPEPEEGGIENSWGESFRVEWVCTERLPFFRIRHLRNPWNHDREVKVSRDGTELEPSVGQRLIEDWHSLATAVDPPASSNAAGKGKKSAGRRNKPAS